MKQAANIINYTLHPIVLTIPAVFLLVYNVTGSWDTAANWTFISAIFSSIISLFVVIGVKKGFFNNLDVSNRKQRVILYPFAIFIVALFAVFVFFLKGPIYLIYASIFFVASLIILDLVNKKIKASVHVAAVSALVTGLISIYSGVSFFLLLLIPLIAWARVIQKRHTVKETIVGALLGIGLTLASLFVVQFILL